MAAGFAACDNGSGDTGGSGPVVVAGSGNGTGGSATGTGGTGPGAGGGASVAGSGTTPGGGMSGEGVPITPVSGWIAKESNALGIQGAAFSFADTTSIVGMTDNLKDATATTSCIKGTAAKVDMASDKCVNKMFDPPATDCYGQYWGAALGFNLNQAIDMTLVPPAGGTPMAFDASLIKGFYFEITDHDDHTGMVPAPSALRFKVDDGSKEYCNTAALKIKSGVNTVLFSDLTTECWAPTDASSKITPDVEKKFIKIAWQVVTNSSAAVPFDFCVGNVRALLKDGAVIPMGTGGSSSTGAGGSAPAAGGSAPAAGGSAPAAGGSSSGGTASASGGAAGKAGSGG